MYFFSHNFLDDWKADGVDNGRHSFYIDGVEGKKLYYKIATGRDEDMNLKTSLNFKRLAYTHAKSENLVLAALMEYTHQPIHRSGCKSSTTALSIGLPMVSRPLKILQWRCTIALDLAKH
jgi:hypothetical protein